MDSMATPEATTPEETAVVQISARLRTRFPDTAPETIDLVVRDALHEFDGHRIRDFVPILVERHAVDLLRGSPTTLTG